MQRNHAFDLLCGICILRMLMNHITSFCGLSGESWWTQTYYWTFFFICFFFFKAGYFNKTTGGDSRAFCVKKARQLLVPYVSWGLIGCTVYFTMMGFAMLRYSHPIEELEWNHLWETGGFWGNRPVWFLLSFFVSYIFMHFLGKVRGIHRVVFFFPLVSYWLYSVDNPLWLSLNNVFMCIYVFQLGHAWHRTIDRLPRWSAITISITLLLTFAVLNILVHGEYTAADNVWHGSPVGVVVNLTLVLCGLSGLLLSLHLPHIPVINFIGQHSMVYFVAHYPLIVLYRFIHISFGRSIIGRWDDWVILMLLVPAICSWLVPYVERVPWLSGRFPQKSD